MPVQKTCRCGAPAQYRGIMYQMGKSKGKSRLNNLKKIVLDMCKVHYLENTFGLWGFGCTKACTAARSKKTGIPLEPKDTIVWIQLETILGGSRPNCPWCGKRMRSSGVKLLDA